MQLRLVRESRETLSEIMKDMPNGADAPLDLDVIFEALHRYQVNKIKIPISVKRNLIQLGRLVSEFVAAVDGISGARIVRQFGRYFDNGNRVQRRRVAPAWQITVTKNSDADRASDRSIAMLRDQLILVEVLKAARSLGGRHRGPIEEAKRLVALEMTWQQLHPLETRGPTTAELQKLDEQGILERDPHLEFVKHAYQRAQRAARRIGFIDDDYLVRNGLKPNDPQYFLDELPGRRGRPKKFATKKNPHGE